MRGLNNHAVVANPNARVTTARVSPRRRSTGSPMSVATAAPTRPAPSSPKARSHPSRAVIEAPTAAPTATNAIWPRLISPAQPVSTTSDSAMTPYTSATTARLVRLSENTTGTSASATTIAATSATPTTRTSGRRASSPRHRSGLAHGSPCRRLEAAAQPGAGRRQPHRDQHDDEQHRLHVVGLVPAPDHRLLDDAERDRGERDRGQPLHAADDRRRQRRQQQRRPEHGAERESDDPGAEEDREERQQRRQHPHDRVHAPYGDAHQRGAVGVVGAGSHRDAETGTEEQPEPDERERDHHERDDVVAAEGQRVDGERQVERRGEALRGQADAEPSGKEQPQPGEQLGEADGGDGEDQPGRPEEPADHEQLDRGAQDDRRRDPHHEGDHPAGAAGHHEQHRERRGGRAEVALGEVEDAVRPVHEGEPEREEGAQTAEDRPLHHDPRRRPPEQLYGDEEGDRPQDPGERRAGPELIARRGRAR